MPPQIKRLALVFAAFILLFLVARHFLVPESFGDFGHYRGLSLGENKEKIPEYAGQLSCVECHGDIGDLKAGHVHESLTCETCHGPGREHLASTDSLVSPLMPRTREFCGLCHSKNTARQTDDVVQVDIKLHNADQQCIECHNPHNPWEQIK